MSRFAAILGLVAMSLAAGCGSPLHLTYDYGRAYTEAFTAQPDLTRQSIANSTYQMYGVEAEAIRILVRQQTTDAESGESTLKNGTE